MNVLLNLVKPLDDFGPEQVEAYFMGCAHRGELRIRVDHATETITFIDEPFANADGVPNVAGPSTSSSARDTPIQPSSTKVTCTRLSTLATVLHNAMTIIDSEPVLSHQEEAAHQATQFAELVAAANAERRALSLHKVQAPLRAQRAQGKEEASSWAELTRAKKLIKEQKEKEDAKKREIKRAQREIESIRMEEAKMLAQDLIKRSGLKVSLAVGPLHAYLDGS